MKKLFLIFLILCSTPTLAQVNTKSAIANLANTTITTNGVGAITGQTMNTMLNAMIYSYCGIAQASDCVLPPNVVTNNLGYTPLNQASLGTNVLTTLLNPLNTNGGVSSLTSSITTGDCLQWGPGIQDSGSSCSGGGGGGLPSGGTVGQLLGTTGGSSGAWQSFIQPDSSAQPRTWNAKVQDRVSVLDYIPAGTNLATTDVSSYFQQASTAACARSPNGLHILIPAGYYIAHDINNTCSNLWEGDGAGGVGSANQTSVGSISHGGTMINYSAASSYFMRWQVVGFPSFKSGAHINGGGIKELTLNDGSSTSTALISQGTQDWEASHIVINGAYNGVLMKGDEFPVTSHISMYGTRNNNYAIIGDLSGQTVSGAACTTTNGDCSTRSDAWYGDYLNNIDNLQTNTVFTITGFVATPTLTHTTGEGPAYGMIISCPNGLSSSLSQCPSFGRFDDIQFENFKYSGVQISDFNNFLFDRLYSVGDGTSNNINNFRASSTNYSSVNIGQLQIDRSELFATGQDCAYFGGTMYDIAVYHTNVSACNILNNNYSGLNFAGTIQNVKVSTNTFGEVGGYGGPYPLVHGVTLGSGVFNAVVTDNLFQPSGGVGYASWNGSSYTLVSPIGDASTVPQLIHMSGNTGPTNLPVLSSCGSGAGISGGYQDSDFIATVGTGVGTSCTVTFGVIQPVAPICTLSPYSGGNSAATVASLSTTGLTISAGSNLTGSYAVRCSTISK